MGTTYPATMDGLVHPSALRRKFEDDFEYLDEECLGDGVNGVVVKCRLKGTHKEYAVKRVNKRFKVVNGQSLPLSDEDKARLGTEIEILMRAQHPNVVRLVAVYDPPEEPPQPGQARDDCIYLVQVRAVKRAFVS